MSIGDDVLEKVLNFEYHGSRLQCDGDDHRMDIAQAVFDSLSHLWTDHRLYRETKLSLYKLSVCSSLTHCCTAWALTRTVTRMINGFNSRCLHVICLTGKDYRVTATTPVYDLVLAVRKACRTRAPPAALPVGCDRLRTSGAPGNHVCA